MKKLLYWGSWVLIVGIGLCFLTGASFLIVVIADFFGVRVIVLQTVLRWAFYVIGICLCIGLVRDAIEWIRERIKK